MHASDRGGFNFVQVSQRGFGAADGVGQQVDDGVLGNGKDVGVGGFFASVIELHAGDGCAVGEECSHRRSQVHFAAAVFDGGLAACIQFGEGNDGNAHAVAGAVHEEGFPENVDAVARVGVLKLFVEGADEDNAPETLDGSLSLGAAVQPFEHGNAAGFLEVASFAFGAEDFEHGAGDGNLVA